ncbi:MAG: hypothetical protein HY686_03900 [Chloroflexi bacterium]|nr:hypothetical protein [Chloroflexota bacterium]
MLRNALPPSTRVMGEANNQSLPQLTVAHYHELWVFIVHRQRHHFHTRVPFLHGALLSAISD